MNFSILLADSGLRSVMYSGRLHKSPNKLYVDITQAGFHQSLI